MASDLRFGRGHLWRLRPALNCSANEEEEEEEEEEKCISYRAKGRFKPSPDVNVRVAIWAPQLNSIYPNYPNYNYIDNYFIVNFKRKNPRPM